MEEHIKDYQIIHDQTGAPAFVVIPYSAFEQLIKPVEEKETIAHEVVKLVLINGCTPARAWREYLCLTQMEMAHRLKISQAAYRKMEASTALDQETVQKLADALQITIGQLEAF